MSYAKRVIQSRQTRQIYAASNTSLLTGFILAAILTYIQRQAIDSIVVYSWFSLITLTTLSRLTLVAAFKRASNGQNMHVWLIRFRLGVLVSGLLWGATSFLLFPAPHPQYQMFLVFILAGMTAGGVISYSADLVSAIVYSICLTAPLAVRLFLAGDSMSLAMSMAAILYLGFMIISLMHINKNIIENIVLHLEAAANEKTVRASEERYRLLLSHSPVGIFHYDCNLLITYCNERFADILHNSVECITGLNMTKLKDQSVLPALHLSLTGETGYYEGYYNASMSDSSGWMSMTCAPSRDSSGAIAGGVAIVQDITQHRAAAEEIKNLAFFDPLTNLPNRRLLMDRLHQALASSSRSGHQGALLFIDLDNFKNLNDTLGHDIGDLLLQQVAIRLESCVRAGDTVARLGGDEFVVMLEALSEKSDEAAAHTEHIGEKILSTLNQPYQLATHTYRNSPSIGITLFKNHNCALEELMKQADIAMYQSKKAGRNTLRFFDPIMQDAINARAELEGELRIALDLGQFQLYYQIQVNQTLDAVGAEALIRWQHPKRGLVSPAHFIPLAEDTDLIFPIGLWVLDQACAQIKAWQDDPLTRHLTLAVNVSAKQFRQADFVDQVTRATRRHGISPDRLKLELTESLLLENIEETISTMNALKIIGVRFSLDDFGTGYSSLQYLKLLPLDQLKIDQSFVRDIAEDASDRAIVRTIIAMAKSLNLKVIAEGVETEVQQSLLRNKGCSHVQGYLFGKPVPIEQFELELKRREL
jgi:diguanylate cyclase (GGDEF)-like protein/PAS domain S-box-containing protein